VTGQASGRPGPVPGPGGTGRLADDLYLIAHHELTGRPHLAPRAVGLGLAGALLAELVLRSRGRGRGQTMIFVAAEGSRCACGPQTTTSPQNLERCTDHDVAVAYSRHSPAGRSYVPKGDTNGDFSA
jgi:hypothetical protein